nr:chorismate mutase [Rahnella sp. RFA10(1/100)]
MAYIVVFLSSLFMVGSVFAASVSTVAISSLTSAMNQRMLDMKDVADYKAAHHLPVEDMIREQSVLTRTREEAEESGLDGSSIQPFIQAQMDVAKAIQYRYFAQWLSQPPDRTGTQRSLDDVRASISLQDKKILEAISQKLLAGGFRESDESEIFSLLQAPHLTDADKKMLIGSLVHIRRIK